jgi:NADH dehydrogenase FAD-containing subunit
MSQRSKVIIIGGGLGDLSAAQALKSTPVDVTLMIVATTTYTRVIPTWSFLPARFSMRALRLLSF